MEMQFFAFALETQFSFHCLPPFPLRNNLLLSALPPVAAHSLTHSLTHSQLPFNKHYFLLFILLNSNAICRRLRFHISRQLRSERKSSSSTECSRRNGIYRVIKALEHRKAYQLWSKVKDTHTTHTHMHQCNNEQFFETILIVKLTKQ